MSRRLGCLLFVLAALGALAALVTARVLPIRAEAIALVDAHRAYQVAHPGWSFPAQVYTAEVDPAALPPERRIAEARARDYKERCPTPKAGEYCVKTGVVVPASGDRLAPIFMGWILGPDAEMRVHLPLQDAPKHLIDAILMAEDQEFYQHAGVNVMALGRALLANLQDGGYGQGASTLSMQVVRNLSQRKEKTLERKLQEMVMAWAADGHLGKEGVLQMYLDAPYLGQRGGVSICGFESASQHYYGKSARDLSLGEAATLAAILPAPGRYAPDRAPAIAKERRDRVLQAMAGLGYDITAALAEPIQTVPSQDLPEPRFPAYFSVLRSTLEATMDPATLYGAGLRITAAIDVGMQAATDEVLPKKTAYFQSLIGRRGMELQSVGVLIEVATGRLLAVYGGKGLDAQGFNRASQARRQPGSAFKPVVYAMAFDQPLGADGKPPYTPATLLPNIQRTFSTPGGPWRPKNVDDAYHPKVAIAYAFSQSQNIATAELLERLGGPKPLIAFAQKVGFDTKNFPEEPGLALGQAEVTPLEMARFMAMIANGGRAAAGDPTLRIVDGAGVERKGPPSLGEPVMSAIAATLTRDQMGLVVRMGTGQGVRGVGGDPGYAGPAVGKTGTTDGEKDLWFIGATPRYAGVVWLGYDTPAGLRAAARDLTAPMWGWWMRKVVGSEDPGAFPDDPSLVSTIVCAETGLLANGSCFGLPTRYVPGSKPTGYCTEKHPGPELDENGQVVRHKTMWERMAEKEADAQASPGAAVP